MLCLAYAGGASATPITFTFGGTISSVDSGFLTTFAVGQTITGSLTFDSAATDSQSNQFVGVYPTAISAYSVSTSGGYSASATTGDLEVTNSTSDRFRATAYSSGVASGYSLTGADVDGYDLLSFGIRLTDSSGTAFQSDALPITLNLSAFDSTLAQSSVGFDFGRGTYGGGLGESQAGFLAVRATITSLTVTAAPTPVPEPGSLLLFGSGVAALVARRRARRSGPLSL